MKTTIDNNQRVFQITYDNNQVFCNLKQINGILAQMIGQGYLIKINHFWNNKPQRASKKMLRDMLAADKQNTDIINLF